MLDPKKIKNLQDILKFAIDKEEKSIRFYSGLLDKVRSPRVANEIRDIIKTEEEHKQLFESIDADEFVKKLIEPSIDLRIAEYVDEVEPKPHMSVKDLFNIAMHREQRSVDLYRHLASLFDGEPRKFFENLAAEESDHKLLFESKWDLK